MTESVKVVLDCDTGIDDSMAIFYGLAAPEIEIVAAGSVWGNTPADITALNTIRLFEMTGNGHIPVAQGAGGPLLAREWPMGRVHGADGQGNTNLPPPAGRPTGEHAARQIVRLAHERPGELTLVPVGPLTNVALALAEDPSIAQLYRGVVLMGGTFLVPGNITSTGEANIVHDPEAAQMVLTAGWPVTLVGLDVTMQVHLTEPLLDQLEASGTVAGRHLNLILQHYLDFYASVHGERKSAMHDALALAIAGDPSLATHAPKVRVDVELNGAHTRGMTVADLRRLRRPDLGPADDANAAVVLEADGPRFLARFMELLCRT
ncbi:MAG: nucleoside hydrolase [Chloroflexi bacterium]|nr:nucleoside hydrolase [Chloroflexota bacterium]